MASLPLRAVQTSLRVQWHSLGKHLHEDHLLACKLLRCIVLLWHSTYKWIWVRDWGIPEIYVSISNMRVLVNLTQTSPRPETSLLQSVPYFPDQLAVYFSMISCFRLLR